MYRNAQGRFASEPTDERVPFSEICLHDAWIDYHASYEARQAGDFLDYLKSLVNEEDHDEVDDIHFCEGCDEPQDQWAETFTVTTGSYGWNSCAIQVCEPCAENNYTRCYDCEDYHEQTTTVYDNEICGRCLEYNYSYCEYCDEYYHHDDDGHYHDDSCDCEAPAQTFTMPNDGSDPLGNDERATISLPAGLISDEGIGAMARLILNHARMIDWSQSDELRDERQRWNNLAYSISEIGNEARRKDGNFTKRLSRFAYQNYQIKVPAALLSEIGNIAAMHSKGVEVALEYTRNLNLPAEDFYHEDSCWWQSYSHSRCSMKSNGGVGMRTFGGQRYDYTTGQTVHDPDQVAGRAWVQPLKRDEIGDLTPTFRTTDADAYVVYNGYGDLEGYAPARILAQMAGMTYCKVGFEIGSQYVNAGGYLVADEETVSNYRENGHLRFAADDHSNLHAQEQRVLVSA